ncbi:23386_t:CDS:2 [Gigaspora rosea]|nr:23386_t:CDS:2 [Gigaspora rosea]
MENELAIDFNEKAVCNEEVQQLQKKMETVKVCIDILEDTDRRDECRDTKVNNIDSSIWAQAPREHMSAYKEKKDKIVLTL